MIDLNQWGHQLDKKRYMSIDVRFFQLCASKMAFARYRILIYRILTTEGGMSGFSIYARGMKSLWE